MADQVKLLRDFLPPRLHKLYDTIRKLDLVLSKNFNDADMQTLEKCLNDACPKTPEEECMRSMFQVLYRRNPIEFCKFLVKSRLHHLMLWTESRTIAYHLKLNRIVHIKWDGEKYVCNKHNKFNKNETAELQSYQILPPLSELSPLNYSVGC